MDIKEKIDFYPGSPARQQISKEFQNPKWEPFRKWFFDNTNKEQQNLIQEEFYKNLKEVNEIIYFVPWFFNKYIINYISVLERNYKLNNGQMLKSVYPPQQHFQINKDNVNLHFSAFQKLLENDTLQITATHINNMIQQQNFTNLYVVVLGEQILHLNKRIQELINQIQNIKMKEDIEEENQISLTKPSIQPPPEIKDFKLKSPNELEAIEDLITKQFKKLKIGESLGETLNINVLDKENNNSDDDMDEFRDQLNKMSAYDNKYADKPTRNLYYYPRPTPQDVLHEEHEFYDNNSYNGNHIYEWNIDGMSVRHINNMMHRMLMYSTICKSQNNNDKTIAQMIIAGFTGQLKGWWDNYLTPEQQNEILNSVKTEDG